MAKVSLANIVKRFGSVEVVKDVSLEIGDEEFVVFVGPSGCGKSTTLRMIAGLEDVTQGEILIGDRVVNELDPKDRDIAMVFQSYALYPHMTVKENLSFGLRLRRHAAGDIAARVREVAGMLDIDDLLDRRPSQLSGGQRQRVAMGRAIVRNPSLFLFDEPLSNLDAKLRVKMRAEIKKLHQKLRTTTIYVTHDQVEAMTLADRIVLMNGGTIEQVGTPHELYYRPATKFVASFIGSPAMNFLPCRLASENDRAVIKLDSGPSLALPNKLADQYRPCLGQELVLGIRPEHFIDGGAVEDSCVDIRVDIVEPMGTDTFLLFSLNGSEVCARVKPSPHYRPQCEARLGVDLSQIHFFDPRTERII
ncbi:MAG: ABC transporter ATP-binding protein [Variibacter sp.]